MLAGVLTPFREGLCPIRVNFIGDAVKVNLNFGKEWRVRPVNNERQLNGDGARC